MSKLFLLGSVYIQLHVKKAEFEHGKHVIQGFSRHCLDFFLPMSDKICHSPIKKVKRQPTLTQNSSFFEG